MRRSVVAPEAVDLDLDQPFRIDEPDDAGEGAGGADLAGASTSAASGCAHRAGNGRDAVASTAAMRIFLDFEASSLGRDGYPIEIGWAAEDGSSEACLIRPAPEWTDWDPAAERVHGLTRERLCLEGAPHDEVARRALDVLAGHRLFVSAPSWDGKWMSVLLRAAGLPRHALRLLDSDEAHREAVREALGDLVHEDDFDALAAGMIETARLGVQVDPPQHRALADARTELEVWRAVRRLSLEEARRRRVV